MVSATSRGWTMTVDPGASQSCWICCYHYCVLLQKITNQTRAKLFMELKWCLELQLFVNNSVKLEYNCLCLFLLLLTN